MEVTSDDDLEVAAVLAKGLGQELGQISSKPAETSQSGRQTSQSPRRSSTVLTNHSRGNTATVTPKMSTSGPCNEIHQMAAKGELMMIEQIIEDSQVNEVDGNGLTPLMWASMYGQADMVNFLLKNGAQPNVTDSKSISPLMTSCYHGHVDTVKALLTYQVDIDMTEEDGNTAIFHAAFGNHANCLLLLLEKGANLAVRNHQGNSAMDIAVKLQHKNVQRTIEQYLMKSLEGS